MSAIDRSAPPVGAPDAALAMRHRLQRELRLLCHGLAFCSWCDTLEAVSTTVRLPGGEAEERLLRAICRPLAGEFELDYTVRRADGVWAVRFFLPAATAGTTGGAEEVGGESAGVRANRSLHARVARAYEAARRLYGARLRR